jgi:hypothetical protein
VYGINRTVSQRVRININKCARPYAIIIRIDALSHADEIREMFFPKGFTSTPRIGGDGKLGSDLAQTGVGLDQGQG